VHDDSVAEHAARRAVAPSSLVVAVAAVTACAAAIVMSR
ncbi:MAG: hypothetical protein RJB61_1101, partial [Actinomycetota bacterium]